MTTALEQIPPVPPLMPVLPSDDFTWVLQAYLQDVLLCLQRFVARHGHRMLQANGTLSDLYVSLSEARALVSGGGQQADPVSEHIGWPPEAVTNQLLAAHRAAMAGALAELRNSGRADSVPLESLRQLFSLNETQLRLLIAAAAPALSVDLSRLYSFAWADFARKKPAVGFLAELVADEPSDVDRLIREFRGNAPLVTHRLVELESVSAWGASTPLLHQSVCIPERIVAHLQNHPQPLPARIVDTSVVRPRERALAISDVILADEVLNELQIATTEALKRQTGEPRLLLVGSDGIGRATALGAVLAPKGWGVIEADLGRLLAEGEGFEASLVEVCREALLRRSFLLIRGEGVLNDREKFAVCGRPMARVLGGYPGPHGFTASRRVALIHRYLSSVFEITFPLPTAAEQRELWGRAISEVGCVASEDVAVVLTERFAVTPGAIHHSVREARARVSLFAKPGQRLQLRATDLTQAVRRKTDHALGAIAEPFSTTLDWDDVVLEDKVVGQLNEILSHAKHRETVYETWGFGRKVPYGRGLSCLFSGPPGTGKTMMAGILAKTLGREIYRVDLSRIISKWVGETEKNLSLAFDEAERAQLMLLFDEADALFSKRTKTKSSNDRFANMEINFLLQRMESYDGITVLTTNKEKSMDEAFRRRIKFKITFAMPDEALRGRLWASMIPSQVACDKDIPYDFLGREFEMSGGNIKNAVIRGAFYAADAGTPITFDHLYKAALAEAREMGMVVREDVEAY